MQRPRLRAMTSDLRNRLLMLLVLPLMVFHQAQLMACGSLAARYAKQAVYAAIYETIQQIIANGISRLHILTLLSCR